MSKYAIARLRLWDQGMGNNTKSHLLLWAFRYSGQVGEAPLMRRSGWATRCLCRIQRGSFSGYGKLWWHRSRVENVWLLFFLGYRRKIRRVSEHTAKDDVVRYRFNGTLVTKSTSPPMTLDLSLLDRKLCCSDHECTLLDLLPNPIFNPLFTLFLFLQKRDARATLGWRFDKGRLTKGESQRGLVEQSGGKDWVWMGKWRRRVMVLRRVGQSEQVTGRRQRGEHSEYGWIGRGGS